MNNHVWRRAGVTASNDIHYWCERCGLLRHDTQWAPVRSEYFQPGTSEVVVRHGVLSPAFVAEPECRKSIWERLTSLFRK